MKTLEKIVLAIVVVLQKHLIILAQKKSTNKSSSDVKKFVFQIKHNNGQNDQTISAINTQINCLKNHTFMGRLDN